MYPRGHRRARASASARQFRADSCATPGVARPLMTDADILRKVIRKKLANGSAPGPSGWTGDVIDALAEDKGCLDGLAAICSAIRSGSLLGPVRDLLLSARLVPLIKPNGGIRPIAIGEALV